MYSPIWMQHNAWKLRHNQVQQGLLPGSVRKPSMPIHAFTGKRSWSYNASRLNIGDRGLRMPPAGNEDNHQPYSSNEIVVGENEVLPLLSMSTLENGADQIQMKILNIRQQTGASLRQCSINDKLHPFAYWRSFHWDQNRNQSILSISGPAAFIKPEPLGKDSSHNRIHSSTNATMRFQARETLPLLCRMDPSSLAMPLLRNEAGGAQLKIRDIT